VKNLNTKADKNCRGFAIYIDSLDAYNRVKKDKLNYPIYTDDPVLAYKLKNKEVINIDSLMHKNENYILGDLSLKISDEIDIYITKNEFFSKTNYTDNLTLSRPLGVLISSILYRTTVFTRFIKEYEIKNLYIYISEKWNTETNSLLEISRFSNIISKLCEIQFFGTEFKFKINVCPINNQKERVDSSINNIFMKSLIFPISVNIREFLKKIGILNIMPFRKKIIIIGEPDGIIREGLPYLNIKGYKEVIVSKVAKGLSTEFDKLIINTNVNNNLLKNIKINTSSIFFSYSYLLKKFFSEKDIINISKIIDDILYFNLLRLPLWITATKTYVSKIIKKENTTKVILASALSTPFSKVVHNILRMNNYSIVLFEHGVTKGISALSSKRLHISEIYNTDHFVGYSNGSLSILAKLVKEEKIKSTLSAAPLHNKKIFFSSLQRLIWKRKLNIKKSSYSLIHVSPYPYSVNRRLGFGSPTETDIFELEKDFIQIYNKLNKSIFYKKYPAYRFSFDTELSKIYSEYKNVKFINDLDYRYIRSAFDIIVTGSPSSTFSWCLSANKPLIYFDSKIINPLINDEVRKRIQKAVFYINIDNNSWKKILKKILDRPYKVILKDWEIMREERKKFINEYIFSIDSNPGAKVANYINNLIINDQ
jgi:hypothetical protein